MKKRLCPIGVLLQGGVWILIVIVTALLVSLSCKNQKASKTSEAPPSNSTKSAKPVLSDEEVDRLKSLGYVDVSDEPAGSTQSGVVRWDATRSYPGYSIYTNAFTCSTEIISPDGRLLHSWSRKPCFRWDNTTLLPDGDLLVVGRDRRDDTRTGGRAPRWNQGEHLARLSWDGKVRWEIRLKVHHDAQLTPDGLVSVLTAEQRLLPELDPVDELAVDKLTIVSPKDGRVLEEASIYEMLCNTSGFVIKRAPRNDEAKSDLLHSNSIDWMRRPELAAKNPLYKLGNVLICMRHQDSVIVIDWKARKVIWHWGQGEVSGPHDAQVLDNGNILIFDNGVSKKRSRVIELDPIARKIVWQWDPGNFFTLARGSNQRLPNGNTLIVDSDSGRAVEVAPNGEIVWEFLNPQLHEGRRVAIVRMRRIEKPLIDKFLQRGAP